MLLRIILLPLPTRFSMICRIWASQTIHVIDPWGERTGLSFWTGAKGMWCLTGLAFSLGLENGSARLFFKPYQMLL